MKLTKENNEEPSSNMYDSKKLRRIKILRLVINLLLSLLGIILSVIFLPVSGIQHYIFIGIAVFLAFMSGWVFYLELKEAERYKNEISNKLKDFKKFKNRREVLDHYIKKCGEDRTKLRQIVEKDKESCESIRIVSSPGEEIKTISEYIKKSLFSYLDKDDESLKIQVAIGCRIPKINKESAGWKYVFENADSDSNIKLKSVVEGKSTLGRLFSDGFERDFIFYNSKKVAFDKEAYMPDRNEDKKNLKGSIFCQKLSVNCSNETVLIEAFIGITSKEVSFFDKELDETGESIEGLKIRREVIDNYENMLKKELLNYYIEKMNIQNKKKTKNNDGKRTKKSNLGNEK